MINRILVRVKEIKSTKFIGLAGLGYAKQKKKEELGSMICIPPI